MKHIVWLLQLSHVWWSKLQGIDQRFWVPLKMNRHRLKKVRSTIVGQSVDWSLSKPQVRVDQIYQIPRLKFLDASALMKHWPKKVWSIEVRQTLDRSFEKPLESKKHRPKCRPKFELLILSVQIKIQSQIESEWLV